MCLLVEKMKVAAEEAPPDDLDRAVQVQIERILYQADRLVCPVLEVVSSKMVAHLPFRNLAWLVVLVVEIDLVVSVDLADFQ